MLADLLIIAGLIAVNGALAMSELAIVSARPGRLKRMAERGDAGAAAALRLASEPGRFLSTVQIGITLVGVLAGAFSGATLGLRLAEALPALGVPEAWAGQVGVGLVVVAITYLSLVAGELVPKQIALAAPERTAARVAPAMAAVSRLAAPAAWVLERSGRAVLALLGQSGRRDARVSEDDIRTLLADAAGAGVIHRAERELIGGVMRFSDRRARGLMTRRQEVDVLDAGASREDAIARFAATGRSRLPVRRGGPDDIVGVLDARDVLAAAPATFDAAALARPADVAPDTLPALQVVERLRDAPGRMLLVYDEYGHFEGLITPMDVLGAIAGGFDEAEAEEPKWVEREDGSLLVAGWTPVDEFAERLGLTPPDDPDYATAAGFVLERMGEAPAAGRCVLAEGWRIEIIDMDGLRIDQLLVSPAAGGKGGGADA